MRFLRILFVGLSEKAMTSSTMHPPPPLSEFPAFKKGLLAYYYTTNASIKERTPFSIVS